MDTHVDHIAPSIYSPALPLCRLFVAGVVLVLVVDEVISGTVKGHIVVVVVIIMMRNYMNCDSDGLKDHYRAR